MSELSIWTLAKICPEDEVLAAPRLEGRLVPHDYAATRRVDRRVLLGNDGHYLAVAGDVTQSRTRRLHPAHAALQVRRVGLPPLSDAYRTPAVPVGIWDVASRHLVHLGDEEGRFVSFPFRRVEEVGGDVRDDTLEEPDRVRVNYRSRWSIVAPTCSTKGDATEQKDSAE